MRSSGITVVILQVFSLVPVSTLIGCNYASNTALSVEVQPSEGLFDLLTQDGNGLVVMPVLSATGSGAVLGPALAACRNDGIFWIETARSETETIWDKEGEDIYIVEKSGWIEIDPATADYVAYRGRSDAAVISGGKPEAVVAAIFLAAEAGCDERSLLADSQPGFRNSERVALSEPVDLSIVEGIGPPLQVGTGGFYDPTIIDLADGIVPVNDDTLSGE